MAGEEVGADESCGILENNDAWDQIDDVDDADLLLVNDDINLNTSCLRNDEKYVGFDNNVAETWIYPSNLPERAYQYNIIQKALFHNTLVVLPTGLGKTFIAAVIMYNMYRWYPMGKVIFMAPTRPLVAQQIEACCKIMGIPKIDSVEITGKLNKANRAQLWQSKRVFFATPQSVQSDIADAELNFPFDAVKLVVVDEAHKAKGRYAYTDVVRCIWNKNKYFRILALSATPGRRKDDVVEIIRNLFISCLEVRTEDSVDVVSYVHKRHLKTVVVPLGPRLAEIRNELISIADPHLRNLIENRLISGRPGSISRNWLLMEHKKFRELTNSTRVPNQKELNSDFSICISIYYSIELLERHGLRVFLNNFDETQESGTKFVLILRPDLRRLIQKIREEIGPNPFAFSDQCMVNGEIAAIPTNIDFGHPKFEIARDHVLAHFENNKEARVIIFCEYRESVMLMHRLLLQHRPLIRPRLFVGQGGTGSIRAVTQNQQINVMNDFRSGKSNALIATSVAEEGIDVGEVDLIVCFDINTSNPTRFIQRIGRTGRKKEGKVLLLATEGKEHNILKEVLSERNRLNKSISRGGEFASVLYKYAPRMIPTEFNPKCLKTCIQPIVEEEPKPREKKIKAKKNNPPKIGQKSDLRHFFKQNVVLNDEEKNIFHDSQATSLLKNSRIFSKNTSNLDETNSSKQDLSKHNLDEILDYSPPKSSFVTNKMAKKFAKYIRNSSKTPILDPQKSIATNKLSKDSLKFLIDFSPDILLNLWLQMEELWKQGIDENNLPSKGITAEDRQTVRAYFQILKILGSKEALSTAVQKQSKILCNLPKKFDFVFGDLHDDQNRDNFAIIIKRFEEKSQHYSPKQLYPQSIVYDDSEDKIDESSRDYSADCIMDSKYMSQWKDMTHGNDDEEVSFTRDLKLVKDSPHACSSKQFCSVGNDSDDDVVFVGTTVQSTPIRKGPLKQSLLNFSETPITSTSSKGLMKHSISSKQSGKNCNNDLLKNKCISLQPQKIEPQVIEKIPVKQDPLDLYSSPVSSPQEKEELALNKSHTSFFDDQFDAIIAANSGIINCIEKNNTSSQINKNQNRTNEPHSVKECSSIKLGTINEANSGDSTPDGIVAEHFTKCGSPGGHAVVNDLKNNKNASLGSNFVQKKDIVHPELLNINFSEIFSEEMEEKSTQQSQTSPQRGSPDIFEELSQMPLDTQIKQNSPIKQSVSCSVQVSPCLLTKKALTWGEVRKKYERQSQTQTKQRVIDRPDESVITNIKINRLKRKIIDSDSDCSPEKATSICDRSDKSVIKNVHRNRHKKRIIDTDSEHSPENSKSPRRQKKVLLAKRKIPRRVGTAFLPRKRKSDFIDDEAIISGSATEDENDQTIGCYMLDSVVVHDGDVENDDGIGMTQVYLQSVRSPSIRKRGAFKIPERRQFNDASRIFSQNVPADSTSYVKDSFVVSNDEGSDIEQSMCPLEQAEQILKARRRERRKAKLINGNDVLQPAKKKRILQIHNTSDDDDFV